MAPQDIGRISGSAQIWVRFKQQVQELKDIPGGAGYGVPIGLWIFSRPGRSKGLLYKQPHDSLINSVSQSPFFA